MSHASAAAAWGICAAEGAIEVSIPRPRHPRRAGIVIHRRTLEAEFLTRRHGIPITTPECTLVDLATRVNADALETAVNEADKLDLVQAHALRTRLKRFGHMAGVARLRTLLDRGTFTITDSQLERRFLPLAHAAGLPSPQTGRRVNGHKVDFFWPELGLVVETDGLRYHRTPAQQTRDRVRDQAHTAAGLTSLRFTHAQVAFEQDHVQSTLGAVARRLRS